MQRITGSRSNNGWEFWNNLSLLLWCIACRHLFRYCEFGNKLSLLPSWLGSQSVNMDIMIAMPQGYHTTNLSLSPPDLHQSHANDLLLYKIKWKITALSWLNLVKPIPYITHLMWIDLVLMLVWGQSRATGTSSSSMFYTYVLSLVCMISY